MKVSCLAHESIALQFTSSKRWDKNKTNYFMHKTINFVVFNHFSVPHIHPPSHNSWTISSISFSSFSSSSPSSSSTISMTSLEESFLLSSWAKSCPLRLYFRSLPFWAPSWGRGEKKRESVGVPKSCSTWLWGYLIVVVPISWGT